MRRTRTFVCLLSVALLAGSTSIVGAEESLPISCFVVHCEPTNATEGMFESLVDLVAVADEFSVPLTIYVTAQWAAMILEDDAKLQRVEAWLRTGHEIGGHHHAYWATLTRNAQWDGYTNTAASDLLPADRARYLGSMDDYMTLLTALPGERTSACMGLDDGLDVIDWPDALSYGTKGHTLDDCVSQPTQVDRDGTEVWLIYHGAILQTPGDLPNLYESTEGELFTVVGHVYNFVENRSAFSFWFRYLHGKDPEGAARRTVTEAIEEWIADDG